MVNNCVCAFNMLFQVRQMAHLSRRFASTFRLGHDAHKFGVKPLLNYEERLNNRSEITANINRRSVSPILNIDDLFAQWHLYTTIQRKQLDVKQRRKSVLSELKKTKSLERSQERECSVRKLTLEETVLNEHLDTLRENCDDIEAKLMDTFLSIPNLISDRTPDQPRQIHSFDEASTEIGDNHLEHSHHIEYYNKYSYYLRHEAANVDTLLPLAAIDFFKSHGFTQFSNPDFANTILTEAALVPTNDLFTAHNCEQTTSPNQLHLVGACSLYSYLGYITRLRVFGTLLPLKWITTGRMYDHTATGQNGLYNVCQSTAMEIFLAGRQDEMNRIFSDALDVVRKFYDTIGIHYRIVELPANELKMSACYSVRVEMYSPHLRKYIEVGHLSDYSNFISKRLMFYYEKDKKKNICDFPHILCGTVCNVTRLIAIVLETYNGQVPEHLLSNKIFQN